MAVKEAKAFKKKSAKRKKSESKQADITGVSSALVKESPNDV